MREAGHLRLHCRYKARVAMPRRKHRNARRHIEEAVAIYIPHLAALRVVYHQWIDPPRTRRKHALVTLDNRFGIRPRQVHNRLFGFNHRDSRYLFCVCVIPPSYVL